ncbi:MAG: carbohydrate kinase [Saprospiraceae bacterium]|nr:carbohydrate kinase [Saprospiraceae bacterium]
MKKNVTAVFDIGKTNKKFFLFDADYQEVYREYSSFEQIEDEDGHPTEDLNALKTWLQDLFDRMLKEKEYNITAINFSTYGASLVHLDENGEVLTPLYNYTKPLDQKVVDSFFEKYGPELDFSVATGSDNSGMLNSGLQLYWLKYSKPEVFKKIRYSLHLPQYISFVFTGIPISEYTSIGCHTALWDYRKQDYHDWVYKEGFYKIFPPIVSTGTSINMNYHGKRMSIGVGIHDSSSALLPYIRSADEKFILVSTGTWSISLNPFSEQNLTDEDVKSGCINYMRVNGKPVKAARLFLGNEYNLQVKKLSDHFKVSPDYHKEVKFNKEIYLKIINDFELCFNWIGIHDEKMPDATKIPYDDFENAYHQLMVELALLQVKNVQIAASGEKIDNLFIDGGFSDNEVYVKLLSHYLKEMELRTTDSSLGSALGAALILTDTKLDTEFLRKNYSLKKHVPFIIS